MFRVSAVDSSDRGIVWFGGEKAEDFFSPSDLETCVEDREEVLVSGTVWKKNLQKTGRLIILQMYRYIFMGVRSENPKLFYTEKQTVKNKQKMRSSVEIK